MAVSLCEDYPTLKVAKTLNIDHSRLIRRFSEKNEEISKDSPEKDGNDDVNIVKVAPILVDQDESQEPSHINIVIETASGARMRMNQFPVDEEKIISLLREFMKG